MTLLYNNYRNAALYEHQFWLQVFGDHSRFIQDALSPNEIQEVQQAQFFINIFDQLLYQARSSISHAELVQLNKSAYYYARQLREFKLNLIEQHLREKIVIHLTPTFINHMVNELEEYLRIIQSLMRGQISHYHPLHHHKLWLLDAVGHADTIADSLDETEKKLIRKSEEFTKNFDDLHQTAMEMTGYLRTHLQDFPALNRLNCQAELKMLLFMHFLQELETMVSNNRVLGTLVPLLLDHMFREECYYLTKLSQVSNVKEPPCDATKPREL